MHVNVISGCYKFSLNIEKRKDFLLYKIVVLFQLGVILYTRVYLWFPAATSFRNHLKEQDDVVFFYCASFMMSVFSLFNLILVADGVKAAVKCIPRKFPKTQAEKERTIKAFRRGSGIDAPGIAPLLELEGVIKCAANAESPMDNEVSHHNAKME